MKGVLNDHKNLTVEEKVSQLSRIITSKLQIKKTWPDDLFGRACS
jgi:hypothetical protein